MAQELVPRCKAPSPLKQSSPKKSIGDRDPVAPYAVLGKEEAFTYYNFSLTKKSGPPKLESMTCRERITMEPGKRGGGGSPAFEGFGLRCMTCESISLQA